MNPAEVTFRVGTLMFIVYSIMASAYWKDAVRWGDRIRDLNGDDPEAKRARKNRKNAEIMFRLSTAAIVLSALLIVITLYTHDVAVANICKYVLLVPLLGLVVIGIRYVFGKYFVDID